MYCVAAVLWTAAKFSLPRDHKLALPRRLKTLLLDMARRSTQERPSAAEAIKVTAQQGPRPEVQDPGGACGAEGPGRVPLNRKGQGFHLRTSGERLRLSSRLPPPSRASTGREGVGVSWAQLWPLP